jgi:hypothetical protein
MRAKAVTDGYPDGGEGATPAPASSREERRLSARRTADRLGGYSVALKSNAKWMKQFLSPGK